MAPVLRLTVTLKGGILSSHPERRQQTVEEHLEQEDLLGTITRHGDGNVVKYLSGGGDGVLNAILLIDGGLDDLNIRQYERAVERGAGGNSQGWMVTATDA